MPHRQAKHRYRLGIGGGAMFYEFRMGLRSRRSSPRPPIAIASITSGLRDSSVLVDGRVCTPATVAAGVAAVATVGVAVAAAGAIVGVEGVCVALAGVAAVRRVPEQGALGRFAMKMHGGNAEAGAVGPLHVDVRNLSLINETKPLLASALP
jgi:hypothetical protein